ncbi:MAG: hypothetical protein ACLPHP_12275 [Candidatus Sulfotelmatobacter sp.]
MCDLNKVFEEMKVRSELHGTIVKEIGQRFAVSLLGVFGKGEKEILKTLGSGTLVLAGQSRCILTASHVWKALQHSDSVGIPLIPETTHAFRILTKSITVLSELKPEKDEEWGPDIVFLKLPNEYVGSIEARKGFYSASVDGKLEVEGKEYLSGALLLGSPKELGTFTAQHADFSIDGLFTDLETPYLNGNFDYFDEVAAKPPNIPIKSYGGMSGGGLWEIRVYCSEKGKVQWSQRLIGVIYYQLTDSEGRRIIRCHGPKTIEAATPKG